MPLYHKTTYIVEEGERVADAMANKQSDTYIPQKTKSIHVYFWWYMCITDPAIDSLSIR